MVCAEFAHTTFDSNSLYLEQLSGQLEFFFRREFRVELLECFGVLVCDKVTFWVVVRTGDSVQEAVVQFLAQEVGGFRVVGVADSLGECGHEAALAVEIDVAHDEQAAGSHLFREFHGMVQENFPVAFPFEIGANADGPEGHHPDFATVIGIDVRPCVHHVPDDFTFDFQDERKFRDEIGIVPVAVKHIMLGAAGTVDVPECFAGEVFDCFKIARLFRADGVIFHCLSPV